MTSFFDQVYRYRLFGIVTTSYALRRKILIYIVWSSYLRNANTCETAVFNNAAILFYSLNTVASLNEV